MARTTILDKCSESDLKRFAVCFLFCERSGINWDDAAKLFDPDVKVASFKTVTNRAVKKALEVGEDNADDNNDDDATPAVPKVTKRGGGRKRKTATAGDDGDAPTTVPKKKGRAIPVKGRGKKGQAKSESDNEKSDEAMTDKPTVKNEDADEEDNSGDEV